MLPLIAWIVMGIAILAIVLVGWFILRDKGISAIDFIKNLFSFRG